jgi:glycosyltransferase involved in cell wall biosynthesis
MSLGAVNPCARFDPQGRVFGHAEEFSMANVDEASLRSGAATPEPRRERPALTAATIDKLRILEIGDNFLFKATYPNQTTLIWAGGRSPPKPWVDAPATPGTMLQVLRDIRAGRYDIVVAYPPLYTPLHPRYWGRAFFRRPWSPWSALTRCWGTSYLRLGECPVPLAIVELEDCSSMGAPMAALLERATLAFKRELPTDRWRLLSGVAHPHLPTLRIRRSAKWARRLAKIRPLNLPVFGDSGRFPTNGFPEKSVDVFFAGGVAENSTLRKEGLVELEKLRDHGVSVDRPEGRLPFAEFCERMSRAWLTWSPEGLGWQCFRHAEAGLCYSVPVINYPTVVRATPLEEGVHAFYYPPESGGLTQTILRALADKEQLQRMACAAQAFSAANFTVKACCDYVLSTAFAEPS